MSRSYIWGQDASYGASCCFVHPPVHPEHYKDVKLHESKRQWSQVGFIVSWHDADSLLLNKVIVCLRCVFFFLCSLSFCYCKIFPPLFPSHAFSLSSVSLRWWLSAPRMRCWALANSKTHLGVSNHLMNDPAAGGRIDTKSVCLGVHAPEHVGGWERWGRILLSWKSH